MNTSDKTQLIDVVLKSLKHSKEYCLEATRNDKLSDIAIFLKNLKVLDQFEN